SRTSPARSASPRASAWKTRTSPCSTGTSRACRATERPSPRIGRSKERPSLDGLCRERKFACGESRARASVRTGKVTRAGLIAGPPLSLVRGSGIDAGRSSGRRPRLQEFDPALLDSQRPHGPRELIENEKLVRISRSVHAAWRDAVRTPWREFRRRLRGALV